MPVSSSLKRLPGKSSEPVRIEVEKGQIRQFAKAIGEMDPIHYDELAAKKEGYPSLLAPLTFPSALHNFPAFYETLGLNPHALMHAEEEYEYFKPIIAGQLITVVHTVADAYEQNAAKGTLAFIILETRGVDGDSQLVFKARRVLVELRK